MSLQLHRPDGKGGLEPQPIEPADWRKQLRSRRWGEALPGGRLPRLKNTEMRPTSVILSIAFWGGLAFMTFAIVVIGYATGFWHFGG